MILERLACKSGVKNDVPNQELAKDIAGSGDAAAVEALVGGLSDRDKAVQSDCIKTLYEIGYLRPELISCYASDLLKRLKDRNNRIVWGAMIALAAVAPLNPDAILEQIDLVYDAMRSGSVITVDNGVRVLANVAGARPDQSAPLVACLFGHLRACRAREVPQHAESTLPAVNAANREEFISILKTRETDMSPSQMARIRRIYKSLSNL